MNALDSLYIDWIKRIHSSINIKIECKEHQQGLDPKLAPYTDNLSFE